MSDNQGFGGFAGFISAMRGDPADRPSALERALAATDKPDEPYDDDDRLSGMVARGYSPGLVSQASEELNAAQSELEAQRTANENAVKRADQIRRMHEAGAITALDIPRLLGDGADEGRVAELERRVSRARQRFAEVQEMIAPPRQRDLDPVEQASRQAHAVFREVTRQRMAEAQRSRPQAPRPKASRASAGAAGAEYTGPDCQVCAEGRRREAAELGYSQYQPADRAADREVTRARRLEDLGYGESSPDGCPPCSDCHYVACRCGQPGVRKYPQAAGEPQVYA